MINIRKISRVFQVVTYLLFFVVFMQEMGAINVEGDPWITKQFASTTVRHDIGCPAASCEAPATGS